MVRIESGTAFKLASDLGIRARVCGTNGEYGSLIPRGREDRGPDVTFTLLGGGAFGVDVHTPDGQAFVDLVTE